MARRALKSKTEKTTPSPKNLTRLQKYGKIPRLAKWHWLIKLSIKDIITVLNQR
jgi:hypothetical protein